MKIKIFLILLLACTIGIFAQDDESFFDSPFALGGGFIAGFNAPELGDVNLMLKNINFPELDKNVFTMGGGGFVYIGVIPGLRLGGYGWSGYTSNNLNIGTVEREAIFTTGGGGITVEYTLPWVRSFGISIGTFIGGGSSDIELFQNAGSQIWIEPFSAANQNSYRKITNSYMILAPGVNIDIPVYKFFDIRLGAAYQIGLLDKWTVNNDKEIINAPEKSLANGVMINAGILIGFFNF